SADLSETQFFQLWSNPPGPRRERTVGCGRLRRAPGDHRVTHSRITLENLTRELTHRPSSSYALTRKHGIVDTRSDSGARTGGFFGPRCRSRRIASHQQHAGAVKRLPPST